MSDEEWVHLLYGTTWEIGFVVDHWYAIRLSGGIPALLRAPTAGELQQLLREADPVRRQPQHPVPRHQIRRV